MHIRSWLFVPGDNERKLAKATSTGADALILDLEDSVASSHKFAARELVRAHLMNRNSPTRIPYWVRINALSTPAACLDLKAVVPASPDGIIVPKVEDPSEMITFSQQLDALEIQAGLTAGQISIIPILESPRAVLTASGYIHAGLRRLAGITWGREDLVAALGMRVRDSSAGELDFMSGTARAHCLLAAKAMGVDAIETVSTDFKNLDSVRAACLNARADGFTGMLAIHPDQVGVINSAFLPTDEDLLWAREVIAAFEAVADAGAAVLHGRMIDVVHLRAARRLLSIHEHFAEIAQGTNH
jgi:citrate lyase subunit beta/citryl-CoA lyase